jgi:hypothetical protein
VHGGGPVLTGRYLLVVAGRCDALRGSGDRLLRGVFCVATITLRVWCVDAWDGRSALAGGASQGHCPSPPVDGILLLTHVDGGGLVDR